MYKIVSFLALVCLTFAACDSDDTNTITQKGDIQIRAKLFYGDTPLVLEENAAIIKENNVRISKFSFYLSDFSLTSNNGSVLTDLFEIQEVSFSEKNLTEAGAQEGILIGSFTAPEGDYTGISMNLGVNSELNSQKPNDFAANHPLGNQDTYWVAWESYIFSILEGRYDSLGNNVFTTTFAWHTGGDESYQPIERAKAVKITKDDTSEITLKIDLKKALEDENAPDITQDRQLHTEANKDIMLRHASLLANAISAE